MKHKLILFILLTYSLCCFSKTTKHAFFYTKTLADSLVNFEKAYTWHINGKLISTHKDTVAVNIHYPLPDTIILTRNDEIRIIITRFEIKHTYELMPLRYDHDIEINDTKHLDFYKNVLPAIIPKNSSEHRIYVYVDSIRTTKETGKVIFRLKNYTKKELIGGTFGKMSWNYTSGSILTNNKDVTVSEPHTSGNSNFCYNITIGTGMIVKETAIYEDTRSINFHYDEGRVFVLKENLVSFECRFFNNETLIVTFDGESNLAKLKVK